MLIRIKKTKNERWKPSRTNTVAQNNVNPQHFKSETGQNYDKKKRKFAQEKYQN